MAASCATGRRGNEFAMYRFERLAGFSEGFRLSCSSLCLQIEFRIPTPSSLTDSTQLIPSLYGAPAVLDFFLAPITSRQLCSPISVEQSEQSDMQILLGRGRERNKYTNLID